MASLAFRWLGDKTSQVGSSPQETNFRMADTEQIFLITKTGLTVVELSSVPRSIGSITPSAAPAARGTQLTIRGSGSQSGATVMIGGIAAASTYVDADTLQVVAPSLAKGPNSVTVTNPDN